jgi:hypothetical protein
MDVVIRKLRINNLRSQVTLRHLKCASLVKQFESESLTVEKKAELNRRWEGTLTECHSLQHMLDLLEMEEDAAAADVEIGAPEPVISPVEGS